MPLKTSIGWTDFSSNPLRYRRRDSGEPVKWACVKVSPGCTHCYSATMAHRFGGSDYNAGEMAKLQAYLDGRELLKLLASKAIAGKRVFMCDMTDLFGEWVPEGLIDQLFAAFALRPDVTFQVLTKRSDRMHDYVNQATRVRIADWIGGGNVPGLMNYQHRSDAANSLLGQSLSGRREDYPRGLPTWPLPNVWKGVSAEDQQRADERIPLLLQTPAAVRFVSAEPLLGPIDLLCADIGDDHVNALYDDVKLDWVIVGGESGPGARLCEVAWIRSIVAQCRAAGVACFTKQVGSLPVISVPGPGILIERYNEERRECVTWPGGTHFGNPTRRIDLNGRVLLLRDRKGSDPSEWPVDLRVQQFPELHDWMGR